MAPEPAETISGIPPPAWKILFYDILMVYAKKQSLL
jgi:hypothetical protein